MKLQKRGGAHTTSRMDQLIENHGQLGYQSDDDFVLFCDLRDLKSAQLKQAKKALEEFLASTPNMRKDALAGLVTFSIVDGNIYCHTTLEGFKANGPGSPRRLRAIDDWMKVNLTPEEYAEEKKKPVKKLEGAELDAWAKARFHENEDQIASLKRNRGRAPEVLAARMTTDPRSGLALH